MDKTMERLLDVLRARVVDALDALPCESRMELLLGRFYRPTDLLDDYGLLDSTSINAASSVEVALDAFNRLTDAIDSEQRQIYADE